MKDRDQQIPGGIEPRRISRRRFFSRAGAYLAVVAAAGLVPGPGLANAETTNIRPIGLDQKQALVTPENPFGEPPTVEQAINLFDNLKSLGGDKNLIREDMERKLRRAESYYKKLQGVHKIALEDLDGNGQPRLYEYFKKIRGKIPQSVIPDKVVNPILSDMDKTVNSMWDVVGTLGQISDLERKGDFEAAKRLAGGIAEEIKESRKKEDEEKQWYEALPREGSVAIIPSRDITLEGSALTFFESRKQIVTEVLDSLPQITGIPVVITLASKQYTNEIKMKGNDKTGEFEVKEIPGGEGQHYAHITIDVDRAEAPGYTLQAKFAHEVGHITDLLNSRAFTDKLNPQQMYSLSLEQQKAINDPVWGVGELSIEALFSIITGKTESEAQEGSSVTFEEFQSLTRTYPNNYVVQNGFEVNKDGNLDTLLNQSSRGPERNGGLKILPGLDLDKEYATLEEFAQAYLPLLNRFLDPATPRAHGREELVRIGLTEHLEAFNNLDFLWEIVNSGIVPKNDKKGSIWLNYCDVFVVNSVLAQALVENDRAVLGHLFDWNEGSARNRMVHLDRVRRGEFYAEAVSRTWLFGKKLPESLRAQNPFIVFSNHVAEVLAEAA